MPPQRNLRLGLPKGRMQDAVLRLLGDAGVLVSRIERGYRPQISLAGFEVKLLKPQNLVEMLHFGSRDLGFTGADWVAELEAEVVEVLDTGLDPVRIVAAAPAEILANGNLPRRRLVVASEYERLTQAWLDESGLEATLVRSYGATEAFPPEDADCIVDNTSTGSTLAANGLAIIDELMLSSTRLYANPDAMADPNRRPKIDQMAMLLRSVLEARRRAVIDLNVPKDRLEALLAVLPSMKTPTVSSLNSSGYAVRAAVPRSELPKVIAAIKEQGGTDVLVSSPDQIVP